MDGCRAEGKLVKLTGELSDDAFTEHISHFERLDMNLLIKVNGCRVITIEVGYSLLEREVKMFSHHSPHLFERPVFGIGGIEKFCDVISIRIPAFRCIFECSSISILCCLEYLCR